MNPFSGLAVNDGVVHVVRAEHTPRGHVTQDVLVIRPVEPKTGSLEGRVPSLVVRQMWCYNQHSSSCEPDIREGLGRWDAPTHAEFVDLLTTTSTGSVLPVLDADRYPILVVQSDGGIEIEAFGFQALLLADGYSAPVDGALFGSAISVAAIRSGKLYILPRDAKSTTLKDVVETPSLAFPHALGIMLSALSLLRADLEHDRGPEIRDALAAQLARSASVGMMITARLPSHVLRHLTPNDLMAAVRDGSPGVREDARRLIRRIADARTAKHVHAPMTR